MENMRSCEQCGGPTTTDTQAVRRYDLGGLPHVVLTGIHVTRCDACDQESFGVPRIAQLHRRLAAHFVAQTRMLAPTEIRFLRKHVGWSTMEFATRMGVARETVSRWETGACPMGAIADRLLRVLVLTHEPTDNYAIDDLLQKLNDVPVPEELALVSLWNSDGDGWQDV
jgi:putative zinc finger/helix-turn-helix YgiT family protein